MFQADLTLSLQSVTIGVVLFSQDIAFRKMLHFAEYSISQDWKGKRKILRKAISYERATLRKAISCQMLNLAKCNHFFKNKSSQWFLLRLSKNTEESNFTLSLLVQTSKFVKLLVFTKLFCILTNLQFFLPALASQRIDQLFWTQTL